ncbi:MAG TPA: NlpC/P60 family protein [Flavobacteriales bacterium]|nr:NlpC/P60 family protein [Flavobacteriales bacterium]
MKPFIGNQCFPTPMKKLIVILLVSFLYHPVAMAQSPERAAAKLQKRYSKSPEKCIQYAKKLVAKRKNRELAYYYLGISYHDIYTENQRKSSLNTSIRYLGEFYKLANFPEDIEGPAAIDAIRGSIEDLVVVTLEKRKFRSASKYAKKYLKLFGDSLQQHALIDIELAALQPTREVSTTQSQTGKGTLIQRRVNGTKLMAVATSLVGTRYRYGGSSKSGLDCSGFNVYVYRQSGITLPHNAQKQSQLGDYVTRKNCKAGDLIFFGSRRGSSVRVIHTGVVYSNVDGKLKIIHCPNRGVTIEGEGDPGWDMYWEKRYLFIKRIINNDLATYKTP